MPEQIKHFENNDEIQRGRWRARAKPLLTFPSSVGSRNPPRSVDSLGLEFASLGNEGSGRDGLQAALFPTHLAVLSPPNEL